MTLAGFLIRVCLALVALAAIVFLLPGSQYTLGTLIALVTVISLFRVWRRGRRV